LVDRRTRAISIDWVNWLSGVRLDLEEIGEFCRKRGIVFMVDSMQGLGALRLDLSKTRVDFMMAGCSKWLLGPQGVGLLYVAQCRLAGLVPTNIGWLSAEISSFQKLLPLGPPKKSAARFEEGTKNLMGICGLKENLKLLMKVGMGEVENRVLSLTDLILEKAKQHDFEILSPLQRNVRSGIVSIRPRHIKVERAYDRLKRHKIIVSLREGWLRISPHFYNTPAEINRMFKVLGP
jgi:selenocysteine lyase/cysteine desulfurase